MRKKLVENKIGIRNRTYVINNILNYSSNLNNNQDLSGLRVNKQTSIYPGSEVFKVLGRPLQGGSKQFEGRLSEWK